MPLTIVPIGGLCNRLRVVLSAYHLAPQLPIPVCVEWGRDSHCFALFSELFQPLATDNFLIRPRRWMHHYNTRRNLHLPGILRKVYYSRQHDSFRPETHGDLTRYVGSHKRVYLSSGYALGNYPPTLINHLQLQPPIEERVSRITDQFCEPTIGVHIRRTDHSQAIQHSSDQAFVRAMEQEIAHNDKVQFYLATDDANVKQQLLHRFGTRVITQGAACNRNTLQGIVGAVVDLYALGNTNKILGSYYSSFTDTAADFRQIPLSIVKG